MTTEQILRVKYSAARARQMRKRRQALRARGRCINGAGHARPKRKQAKCDACLKQHRRSNRSKP
jgi:hypothetical protein